MNTLFEFLDGAGRQHNQYVTHPGWDELYVRRSTRDFGGGMRPCIDLARMTASEPGKGAFRNLVVALVARYPDREIFVESVQTAKFETGLKRLGFEVVHPSYPPSFRLSDRTHDILRKVARDMATARRLLNL